MDNRLEIVGVSLCAMISAPIYGVREIDTDLLLEGSSVSFVTLVRV